ncbi:MAG: hypothetical protein IJ174_04775, partial [Clostridia bacterium]|nr:hypothetical protein [Clostridia bacterium]
AQEAASLWDREAFTRVFDELGDWVGHLLDQPFNVAPLWYFIACFLRYVTGSSIPIRILNICLSALAVGYTGLFVRAVYGEKAGKIAAAALAFLPFPVLYSCFAYKEQLVMLLTMVLFYHAVLIRQRRFHQARLISTALCALCLLLTRSGVSAALIVLCLLFALVKPGYLKQLKNDKRVLALTIAAGVAAVAVVVLLYPTIRYKLDYYLSGNAELEGVALRLIAVTSVQDLYKLPLTWFYAMLSPVSLFHEITCYYDITAMLNVTLVPVAVAAVMYLFKKKPDPLVYYGCLLYYLISVIPSIAIFRHYFSLLPLTLAGASAYVSEMNEKEKRRFLIISAALLVLIIGYYFWRNHLRA